MTVQGFAVLYVVLVLLLFAAVAWKTPILRDRGALAPGVAAGGQTFSLARSQLLWWTLAIALVAGWQLILTGNLLSPTPQVLLLLGISAVTSSVAGLVDQQNGAAALLGASRGWLQDILDDGQGVSIHRYQALLANLGLGLAFIYKSIALDRFYEIDPMWLGVLGVSSALYVGVKSREGGIPAAPAAAPAAAQPQPVNPGGAPPALTV
ncbi:hypothetical protein ACPRNU_04740 [Chromobacterium vaccinii]|uniref:hypothetical protein n=1 Tax=Chromobacterium vaccinii TaxID=1108595 RepID=UPI003C783C4F